MPFVAWWGPVLNSGSVTKCHKVARWVGKGPAGQNWTKQLVFNKFRKKWEEHNGLGLIWSSVGFGLTEKSVIFIECIKETQLFTLENVQIILIRRTENKATIMLIMPSLIMIIMRTIMMRL